VPPHGPTSWVESFDALLREIDRRRRPWVLILDRLATLLAASPEMASALGHLWTGARARGLPLHLVLVSDTDAVLDPLLADRAIERMGAGVEVMGIWDQVGIASSGLQAERMCDAGARIGTEDLPGKVHHKFAVIDVHGSDPTVILGSYNWTVPGAYENDENTLIIHDAALAQAYYEEWQRLWGTLAPERICNEPVVFIPLVAK